MEIIDRGHPHCHIHEVEMMDHVKRSIAASYTSLLSRLESHIEDNNVHVSIEEKDKWNNKADKTQIRDLEMRLTEKADGCDLIELKESLARIKSVVNENTSGSGSSDSLDYITANELERRISGLLDTVADMIGEGTSVDLSNYYTKSETNNRFYTKNEVDAKISTIPTQPGAASVSYTDLIKNSNAPGKYQIGTLTVNGTPFEVWGKDASGGSNVSVNDRTLIIDGEPYDLDPSDSLGASDVSFVQDDRVPTSGDGSYKIGELKVADSTYSIYGKDFVGTGGGLAGTNGGYYEIAFKAFSKDTTLSQVQANMPTNGAASLNNGWSHSAENNDGSKAIWMINRFVSGTNVYGNWLGPWQISGANGDNGVDGDKMEYIYTRTVEEELPSVLVNALSFSEQSDDYVPSGWYDNPQGVNQDNRFEWMAFRTKTFSKNDPEGTWSEFIGPVLWSAYGRNGTDGDGIEYIYFAAADGETYFLDPSEWSTDLPGFQDGEYYLEGWQDDPINIETLGKGARQWVCVRKKYADNEGEEPYWHAYSAPALWSYYAKDGQVGGIVQAVQYSIQPTFANVTVSYGNVADSSADDSISGTVKWRVVRSEGTNTSVIGPNNEYGITTEILVGGDIQYNNPSYADGEYSVLVSNSYEGSENFIEILAHLNNNIIASTIVPIIIPGKDGLSGESYTQSLNFEVLRVRSWVANPDPAYNNGTVIEDGVKYLDIVERNGVYYKCLKAGTSVTPGEEPNPADPAWATFSAYGDGWFETMIAKSAYIQSLTAKQIVVTDANNKPVAGMLNGTAIPTQLTDIGVLNNNTNGIRIFAGDIPQNGNVYQAPFTVDNAGHLKAEDANITGTITATQGTFSNCTIDNTCTINGTLNYNGIIGTVQTVTSSTDILNGVVFAIINGPQLTIKFPSNPAEGQTLYIKHSNLSTGITGSKLIPNTNQNAYIYAWETDSTYDVDSSHGYAYLKKNITSAYNPSDLPTSLTYNVFDGHIHQYIYSNGTWYELTSGYERSTSI